MHSEYHSQNLRKKAKGMLGYKVKLYQWAFWNQNTHVYFYLFSRCLPKRHSSEDQATTLVQLLLKTLITTNPNSASHGIWTYPLQSLVQF